MVEKAKKDHTTLQQVQIPAIPPSLGVKMCSSGTKGTFNLRRE